MHLFDDPRSVLAITVIAFCLAALFIGTTILRKAGKKVAWWLSLVSLVVIAGGFAAFLISAELADREYATGSYARSYTQLMIDSYVAVGFGAILFVAGYLGTGLRTARAAKRVAQLELLRTTVTGEVARRRAEEAGA